MHSLFSDDQSPWQPVPQWAQFFIQLGRVIRKSTYNVPIRKIALISMPCESVGAGLIALGAHVSALSESTANDREGYFDYLAAYARQYLSSCRDCNAPCFPARTRCGYDHQVSGIIKTTNNPRLNFRVCGVSSVDRSISFTRVLSNRNQRDPGVTTIFPSAVLGIHVGGEPPPDLERAGGASLSNPYGDIVPGAEIVLENLKRTFSGICLAGRVAGNDSTHEAYSRARFKCTGSDFTLAKLLTVHAWGAPNEVSRMIYFNSRTGDFDRRVGAPQLAVADGHGSFLRVLDNPAFQSSNIIGVFHRAIDRDRSEEIGNKLQSLRAWYENDVEAAEKVRVLTAPRGITMTFLQQRAPQ